MAEGLSNPAIVAAALFASVATVRPTFRTSSRSSHFPSSSPVTEAILPGQLLNDTIDAIVDIAPPAAALKVR